MSLESITEKTIISKTVLIKEILRTRKRDMGSLIRSFQWTFIPWLFPYLTSTIKFVAAINVTMDARHKLNPEAKRIREKLIQKGKLISRLLGYSGLYPGFETAVN